MPVLPNPALLARQSIAGGVRSLFASSRFPQEQYTDPPGDPGLFGPSSVTWAIHADVAMFVGGISAVMLQALHPLAMAGVVEHSRFREAPLERLSRTSSFVGATTYASTEVAESIIDVVRRMHRRVVGVAPDGRPYDASDPALLRWIHVAETVSFVRAHQRYSPFPRRGADLDRYYSEMAVVAEKLGATEVPRSRPEVREYLRAVRPELVAGREAADVMRFLRRPMRGDPASRAAHQLLVLAAEDLLPGWARALHGIERPRATDLGFVRPATGALLMALRGVLGTSPVLMQAKARAAAPAG
ncbi:MAG: DUF2236 domain-containing protein [Actinobacteria bacterium]|nr:DUF2236 domain-containing protein [Actinomycetota bacterium]